MHLYSGEGLSWQFADDSHGYFERDMTTNADGYNSETKPRALSCLGM